MIKNITVLGSGTLIPQKGRSCAGYVLGHSRGSILLDCGPGSLLRLNEAGTPLSDIDLILISHFHLDHTSDLAPLLNSRWLQKSCRDRRLIIAGPVGLKKRFARLFGKEESWIHNLTLDLIELANSSRKIASLKLDTLLTPHTENSICFRLTDEEGSIVFYSGDTDYHESLIPLAREANLAIIECSWTEFPEGEGHLTPQLAGKLASKAQVKRLLLTHFYQEVSEQKVLKQVAKYFHGTVYLAKDLQVYPI